jgi:uncharacterized DUF497 family protein
MKIEFDEAKNAANIKKHGFSLDAFELLDFDTALFVADDRKEYSEERILVFGLLNGRLCTAVFTVRKGVYRVISLRKSNEKERKRYEKS